MIGRVAGGSYFAVVGHGSLGCLVDFMELLFTEEVPGIACFCYGGGAQEVGHVRRNKDMLGGMKICVVVGDRIGMFLSRFV